jgi:hypothetical protein
MGRGLRLRARLCGRRRGSTGPSVPAMFGLGWFEGSYDSYGVVTIRSGSQVPHTPNACRVVQRDDLTARARMLRSGQADVAFLQSESRPHAGPDGTLAQRNRRLTGPHTAGIIVEHSQKGAIAVCPMQELEEPLVMPTRFGCRSRPLGSMLPQEEPVQ